jgi:hypothetical protein
VQSSFPPTCNFDFNQFLDICLDLSVFHFKALRCHLQIEALQEGARRKKKRKLRNASIIIRPRIVHAVEIEDVSTKKYGYGKTKGELCGEKKQMQ